MDLYTIHIYDSLPKTIIEADVEGQVGIGNLQE